MLVDYAFAFALVIGKIETGATTNDPDDPGRLTRWGITQGTYEDWGGTGSVADLTEEQAKALFRKHVWEKAGCDQLKSPLNLYVFSAAVHMGDAAAVRLLQKVAKVTSDGRFGPVTAAAAARIKRAETYLHACRDFYTEVCATRARRRAAQLGVAEGHGREIARYAFKYARGWYNRLDMLRDAVGA